MNKARVGQTTAGGDPQPGAVAIVHYGCGACHTIGGIPGAVGIAGPPLSGIGTRLYLAGVMQNTPENMIRWTRDPKAVDEKTLMPNLGVNKRMQPTSALFCTRFAEAPR